MSAISQRTVRFLVLLVWLFTITTSTAQTFSFFKTGDGEASKFPKHEVRAVWLTTIGGLDWPRSYARDAASVARQQRELTDILDRLQRAGINTVLLQVRIRGTVMSFGRDGKATRIRCFAVCHRRMSSTRNGASCVGGDYSGRKMERYGLQGVTEKVSFAH